MDYKSEFERGRKIAERRGRGTVGETEKATAKVRLSEAQKKAKAMTAQKEAAKKASRKSAAKAAVKAAGKGAKAVAKRIGPVGIAYGGYEVSQGRVPVISDAKDLAEWAKSDEAKMIADAVKEDPMGMAKDTLETLVAPLRKKVNPKSKIAEEYGYAKGGEVKGKGGHCRGGGKAIQGTKFKGVK
jgi:hypothetical protein